MGWVSKPPTEIKFIVLLFSVSVFYKEIIVTMMKMPNCFMAVKENFLGGAWIFFSVLLRFFHIQGPYSVSVISKLIFLCMG